MMASMNDRSANSPLDRRFFLKTSKATQSGQRVELTLGRGVTLNAKDFITTNLEFA